MRHLIFCLQIWREMKRAIILVGRREGFSGARFCSHSLGAGGCTAALVVGPVATSKIAAGMSNAQQAAVSVRLCTAGGALETGGGGEIGRGGEADDVALVEGVGVKQTRAVITPESGSTRPTL